MVHNLCRNKIHDKNSIKDQKGKFKNAVARFIQHIVI